jgi:hypothetical protein
MYYSVNSGFTIKIYWKNTYYMFGLKIWHGELHPHQLRWTIWKNKWPADAYKKMKEAGLIFNE